MPNDRQQVQPGKFSSFDWGPVSVSDSEMGDGKVTDWAISKLAERPVDSAHQQPMFLAIGYYRPHIPLYAPQAYFDLYPVASTIVPEVLDGDLSDVGPSALELAHSIQTAGLHSSVIKHGQWKDAVAAYLACVSFVDAQIGRLLDALDSSPYAENTIVVLWSDHGWHLGEKEHWGKTTGWERSTRVPLVIVPAKSQAAGYQVGKTCAQPVSLIDLYPTLIDMCHLEKNSELDGVSLAANLRAPDAENDRVVVTTVNKGTYSARDNRWRYIRYADGTEELYDHESDSQEWHNLANEPVHASTIARIAEFLPGK